MICSEPKCLQISLNTKPVSKKIFVSPQFIKHLHVNADTSLPVSERLKEKRLIDDVE